MPTFSIYIYSNYHLHLWWFGKLSKVCIYFLDAIYEHRCTGVHLGMQKIFAQFCSSKTLYSIKHWLFTKIRVSWNGGLPLHVPNFKIFLTLLKFEWDCFN